jgi:hypothetical protein
MTISSFSYLFIYLFIIYNFPAEDLSLLLKHLQQAILTIKFQQKISGGNIIKKFFKSTNLAEDA